MSRNIKLTIEYDGTDFNGWQIQNHRRNSSNSRKRTVQGEIEKALKKIFKKPVKLYGSGRTDSGVHALGQVGNFKTTSKMPTDEIIRALNANLPEDIAILNAEDVASDFHAQYSAKSKTYRYTVLNRAGRCAQQRDFCLYFPYKLNLTAMREESKCLIGRKDFRSFTASDPARRKAGKDNNTTRTVKKIAIRKKGDAVTFDIQANGFLYKMVRNIVGTLLDIGTGRLPKGSIKKILAAKNRDSAGNTAKSKGLALLEVCY